MTDALDRAVEEARKAFVSEIARLSLTGDRAGPYGQAVRAYRTLEAAIAARACRPLVEALNRYGIHDDACDARRIKPQWTRPCTCGFGAALAAYRGAP